jgi:two-component system response regulator FixJ
MPPTIYVVDDDAAVRDSLRLLLETHDRQVRDFASPGLLLQAARDMPAGCLVLDYQMPTMTGLDLLAELRRRGIDMPAILITGRCDGTLKHRAAAAGVVGVLEKPFPDGTLLAMLSQALGGEPRAAEANT